MEQYQLKSLLSQVAVLNAHYKKIDALTGDNFNIFRILKLETSEVRLHSAFLATLLDPNGNHGHKDSFLKLFVNQFCFKQTCIDTETCKVEIEKHTGFISEDGTEGGRIDIIVRDNKGNCIIIENKIYAGDQRHQLTRYYNHAPNADLIYLTLDGKLPSEGSYGELKIDEHFKCYSYRKDILLWLDNCRKEATIYPILRESITQYINLIKHLTNQTINHTMQEELNQLLLNNIEASFTIADNLDFTLDSLLKETFTPKLEEACKKLGLQCKNGIDFKKNYSGIWLWNDEWQHVNIGFQFWNTDKNLNYGFVCKSDPINQPIPQELRTHLNKLIDHSSKQTNWWPFYHKMEEPLDNWSKYQAWKAIADGTMLSAMIEKIEYLLEVTNGLQL